VPDDLPPTELEMMTQAVHETLAKHLNDPNLLPANALVSCYHPKGVREYDRNSPEGIRKSLAHCHDVNVKLIAANDGLRQLVLKQATDLDWERTWRWGIIAGVVIAVIAAFALHFAQI
jgi:hypothetical protein